MFFVGAVMFYVLAGIQAGVAISLIMSEEQDVFMCAIHVAATIVFFGLGQATSRARQTEEICKAIRTSKR